MPESSLRVTFSVLSHRLREEVPFFASSHRLLHIGPTDTGDNSPLSSSTESGPSQGINPGHRWFAVGVARVLSQPTIVDLSTVIGARVSHLANNCCIGQYKSLSVIWRVWWFFRGPFSHSRRWGCQVFLSMH